MKGKSWYAMGNLFTRLRADFMHHLAYILKLLLNIMWLVINQFINAFSFAHLYTVNYIRNNNKLDY
jgi:hypothetical protein